MLTRRHFIITGAALFSPPIVAPVAAQTMREKWAAWDARVTPRGYDPATSNPWGLHPRFLPVRVETRAGLTPGDIHVDAVARYLYHIEPGGTAMRYGVAIARGALYEPGRYTIARKARWPSWRPTDEMIERGESRLLEREYAHVGDTLVCVAGASTSTPGGTDMLKIHYFDGENPHWDEE